MTLSFCCCVDLEEPQVNRFLYPVSHCVCFSHMLLSVFLALAIFMCETYCLVVLLLALCSLLPCLLPNPTKSLHSQKVQFICHLLGWDDNSTEMSKFCGRVIRQQHTMVLLAVPWTEDSIDEFSRALASFPPLHRSQTSTTVLDVSRNNQVNEEITQCQ